MTLSDVITTPLNKPLSPQEDKVLGLMLKRLATEKETTVELPVFTGGRRVRHAHRYRSIPELDRIQWKYGPSLKCL